MYFLSRCYLQYLIADRDADGIASKRLTSGRQVWAAAMWKYPLPYELKAAPDLGKTWGVCIVPDGTVISQRVLDAIANDPDVIAVFTSRTQPLDTQKRATLDAAISTTDFGVQTRANESVNDVVGRIVKEALGHSAAFKPDEAGAAKVGVVGASL